MLNFISTIEELPKRGSELEDTMATGPGGSGKSRFTEHHEGVKQSFSEEDKERLKVLLAALEPFKNLRHTMPLQYVLAYLYVALKEGQGTMDYAKEAGVSPSVMSRHLQDIGDRNRYKEEGFGLVTQEHDIMNLRRNQATLTPKGKGLGMQILRALERLEKMGKA